MPRQRNPKRDKARDLWLESGKTRKLKDIAAELGESESRIRKWKSEDGWDKGTLPKEKGAKRSATKRNAPITPPSKQGAPYGNKNAVGNKGGGQNHLIHGGYSKIYWDTLDEEERELIATMETDEELQLQEQIRLLTIRERRLMRIIQEKKQQKAGQSIQSVIRNEDKRTFKTDEEKELYERIQQEKVDKREKLPGESYHITTTTESTDSVIMRLEQELTAVQRTKTRCISELSKIHIENRRYEDGVKGNELVNDWISGVIGGGDDE